MTGVVVTADPNTAPDEMIDPVLAERARAAYRARDVLFGMDPSVEDVLIVADWLLTGRCELAMAFEAHWSQLHPTPPAFATEDRALTEARDIRAEQ